MKSQLSSFFWVSVSLFVLAGCTQGPSEDAKTPIALKKKTQSKPNILLILTDDQGYGDLGFTGNTQISTPTIDNLFKQGVSFNRFYVSAVCAPTRASLLSGKHYLKTGVFHVTRGGEKMHSSIETLAERLKPHGYNNGLFGKWHNGLQYPHDPIGQGFDEFYGFSAGHLSEYFDNYLHHNNKKVKYEGYVADAITDKAVSFINQQAQSQSPFFTMLSFNTPHGPFQSPADLFAKYKAMGLEDVNASIYAMMENIDQNVEKVVAALKANGQLDNTIILYTSDNGPAFPNGITRYNANLKGHKGIVDEGGVRSPLAIYWPDGKLPMHKVAPITQHIDIVPTLLSLANIDFDANEFDGKDLTPLLVNTEQDWPERYLFTHRFRISKDSSKDPIQPTPAAVRSERYLALAGEDKQWRLFDLLEDPSQKTDLAETKPQVLAQYKDTFTNWYEQITAAHMPYKTIPIEVGHAQNPEVLLPAHEALIKDNLDYKHGAGWSHDWLVAINENDGSAYWPLKVVSTGRYRVNVSYATETAGFIDTITLSGQDQILKVDDLNTYVGEQLSTKRQYYTDEAPDLTWQTINAGVLELNQGTTDLVISFSKDKNMHNLSIKEVTITQLGESD
jgi:arylsulfatase A